MGNTTRERTGDDVLVAFAQHWHAARHRLTVVARRLPVGDLWRSLDTLVDVWRHRVGDMLERGLSLGAAEENAIRCALRWTSVAIARVEQQER